LLIKNPLKELLNSMKKLYNGMEKNNMIGKVNIYGQWSGTKTNTAASRPTRSG
jgi:hypothetical protein